MARVKRWTVPFVSLNGTECHVDIYDEDYEGDVITLQGAANPFEYEEDDSTDMLNGVIRYRTGYLRVVEHEGEDLSALFPQVNTERYIEFYYGSTLDFVGFILAEDFGTAYAPKPRVLELPISSPMGIADGVYIDDTANNPPRWKTLGNTIRQCLALLNADYEGFIFPRYLPDSVVSNSTIMNDVYINSLAICPWGGKYNKVTSSSGIEGIYAPKSVAEVMEMMCTTFGCILHDLPGHPIFQRIDYTGKYCKYHLAENPTLYTPQSQTLGSVAEILSDKGEITRVLPLADIDVEYEGDDAYPTDFTFDRCKGYMRGSAYKNFELATNLPVIGDYSSTMINYATGFDSNGMMTTPCLALGAYGEGSLSEAVLFQATNGSWTDGDMVFSMQIYEWPGNSCRLKFSRKYGNAIDNLNNPEVINPFGGSRWYCEFAVRITSGNYYYIAGTGTGTGWISGTQSSGYAKVWTQGEDSGDIYILPLIPASGTTPQPLTVEFYITKLSSYSHIHVFSDIHLDGFENAAAEYLYKNSPNQVGSYTIKGDASDGHGKVDKGFGIYSPTINRFRYDSAVTGTIEVYIADNEPSYPYALIAQKILTVDVDLSSLSSEQIYLDNYSAWAESGTWRIISRSFYPWEDKTTLMLHSYEQQQ